VGDLIEAVAEELRQGAKADFSIRQTGAPRKSVCPDDDEYHHSCALWYPVLQWQEASLAGREASGT
jgi:hypothetical protein